MSARSNTALAQSISPYMSSSSPIVLHIFFLKVVFHLQYLRKTAPTPLTNLRVLTTLTLSQPFLPQVLFIVNCYMNMMMVFVYFGQIFMTLAPPHWCAPPPGLDHFNLTKEQLRDLTIPKDLSTGKYEKCLRYNVDFIEVS